MSKYPPVGTDSTTEQVLDLKPKKSKKRSKHAAHSVEAESSGPITGTSAPVEDDPSRQDRLKEKARKKKARVHLAKIVEDPPTAEVPEAPKKSKKRKHQCGESVDQIQEDGLLPEEPPKKKHKNRTEFSDPRVDATLNNQSRKGA